MWIKLTAVVLGIIIGWNIISDFDEESVRGKRVFVTGASTGIGEQLAYEFCRLGADVVITARREAVLKQVIEKCRQLGRPDGKYFYLTADMSDLNSTGPLVQEATRRLGGLDYLVLNHITENHLVTWTGSANDFTSLDLKLDVNFKSYVYLATHALAELEKSEGRIVVVSSMAGKVGTSYFATYSTSKFALNGFFSSLRQELMMRGSPVSVTVAVIGLVGTETVLKSLEQLGVKSRMKITPASPADTAHAIIVGGANRQWEVYFPYMRMRLITLFRDWFPQSLALMIRSFHEGLHGNDTC